MNRRFFSLATAIFAIVLIFATATSAQQVFKATLNAIQEVPTNPSQGRGVCTITLNAAETQISVSCTYSGLTSALNAGHIHNPAPPGMNNTVLFNFNPPTGSTSGTFNAGPFTLTAAQLTALRSKLLYVNLHTTNFPGGEIRGQVKISTTVSDVEGDGRADITVFRQSDNTFYSLWSINNSIAATRWGSGGGDIRISDVADFDGDGRSDPAIVEVAGTDLYWSILQTSTNTLRNVRWGLNTDLTVPADYDGDGIQDIAVFRRTTGIWYIIQSSNGAQRTEPFGAANDISMVGDFDKDGRSDLTVLRGVAGVSGIVWFTRRSSDNTLQTVIWGGAPTGEADFVFPSAQVDIDADGRQDHMVVRDSNGTASTGGTMTHFIRRSSDGQPFVLTWGLDSDARFLADYDGDGRTDIAARRTIGTQLVWFIYQSSNGQARVVPFGAVGDQFVGDPKDATYSVAVEPAN